MEAETAPNGLQLQRLPERRTNAMNSTYTAVIGRDGPWWIGWIEEVPGVNSQGESRQELIENLRSALRAALDMNRAEARSSLGGEFEEESIQV
jgi:predicted RNase H-like HicB family nuclease